MKRVPRVHFYTETNISEVLKFDTGVIPTYGKGTMKGVAWCSQCRCCVGDVVRLPNGNVLGWLDPICYCGNQINWSEAEKYL